MTEVAGGWWEESDAAGVDEVAAGECDSVGDDSVDSYRW